MISTCLPSFLVLGITLFELVTGCLPFKSADPLEYVFCHLAVAPPRANQIDPTVPKEAIALNNISLFLSLYLSKISDEVGFTKTEGWFLQNPWHTIAAKGP